MSGPLTGIRIADFSQLVQGPNATQLLGDMGADVVKIEPLKGDWQRHWSLHDHFRNGESLSFLTFNRSKRSIGVNLKDSRGKDVALRIIRSSDVVVENFRPGVMDRLGLGYSILSAEQPGIVYCASSGWGVDGPYETRPGQDLLAQSVAGVPNLNGSSEGPPQAVGMGIADLTASLHITIGILAALHQKQVTGIGQRVDANLLNSIMNLATQELTLFFNTGIEPQRSAAGVAHPYAGAPFGIYETSDGYVAVAMMPLGKVAEIVGVSGFAGNESRNSIEGRDQIKRKLDEGFRRATTHELLERLLKEDIWCAPVNSFPAVERDPQVLHNKIILEFEHPTAGKVRTVGPPLRFSSGALETNRPPLLGEHTKDILQELGFSQEEISNLAEDQVVSSL